jgi:hypothetical protein
MYSVAIGFMELWKISEKFSGMFVRIPERRPLYKDRGNRSPM